MCVRILKVIEDTDIADGKDHEQKYCVEFQKLKGDLHTFHTHFNDIINEALSFTNDTVIGLNLP